MKLFKKNWVSISLIFIIGIASILRLWHISENPPELHPDEITNVVSARSIIETGKDLNGRLLPYFYYRVQLHPPIYGYTAYLFTKLLGDSVFAIRLPAVLFGLAAILILYQLTIELTKKKVAGLLTILSMAIIPWHIHFSRVGYDPASLLPFLLFGIVLLIKGITEKTKYIILISFALFGLVFYTYLSGPFYSIFFLSTIILFNFSYFIKNKKVLIIGLLIFGLITLPFLILTTTESGFSGRTTRISTFATGLNSQTIQIFIHNYLSHYTPNFLFISGDPNFRNGAQTGVLYWWMLPFIITGIIYSKKLIKTRWQIYLILLWFITFPLPGALTNDGVPHATRTLLGAPIFSLLTGIGLFVFLVWIYQNFRSKIILTSIIIFLSITVVLSLFIFIHRYFLVYPYLSQSAWDYGYKEAFGEVKILSKNYYRVCLGDISYWHRESLINYYLWKSNLAAIEDTDNPLCKNAGSIIVQSAQKPLHGQLRKTIFNLSGIPVYSVLTID